MANFIVDIDCDNAAFEDEPGHELARILREVADKVEEGTLVGKLRDINGGTVGAFQFHHL